MRYIIPLFKYCLSTIPSGWLMKEPTKNAHREYLPERIELKPLTVEDSAFPEDFQHPVCFAQLSTCVRSALRTFTTREMPYQALQEHTVRNTNGASNWSCLLCQAGQSLRNKEDN